MAHNDPAARAAYAKRYRELNREKVAGIQRRYVANNRDYVNEHQKMHHRTDHAKAKQTAWRKATKEARRAKVYGLTAEQVRLLWQLQDFSCPVCETPLVTSEPLLIATGSPLKAVVDHCHDAGRVRGLLCNSCNTKEGWFKKNGERLRRYLDDPPAALLGFA